MKNKNKKNRKIKKSTFFTVLIIVLVILVGIGYLIKKNNDENGVFSLLENRWIEKNKSTIV